MVVSPPSDIPITASAAGASHRSSRGPGAGVMDDMQLARFVSHYERLTRHIWAEMPGRADLCLTLAEDRTLAA